LAPLAMSLTCAVGLTVTDGVAAAPTAAGASPDSTPSLPGVLAPTLSGLPGTQMAPPKPLRTKLRIGRVNLNVLDGFTSTVRGELLPAGAGRAVYLQRLGRHGWHTLAHSFTGARGRFQMRYVPRHLLSEPVRVEYRGDARHERAHRRLGVLNSYRLAGASWYGGGGSLACGGELTSATMGVANKTLPCGTRVTLRYGGRSVRVRVIDRGPYVAGRDFDLTEATKRALGFEGVGNVWSTR
jgi:rare lipoprotein A